MKIAPEKGRAPIPADQAARITDFATNIGGQLPVDYLTFLTRYDGGFPYPNVFDEVTPDAVRRSVDRQAFCDRLFDLENVAAHSRGETFGKAVPTGFLLIGEDPGGLIFLLSLRPDDFGALFLWQANSAPWGSAENNETHIFQQASSFSDFLDSLYDTEDKIGYDHWATPFIVANAVELDLK
jgi:hypothetical protein